MVTTQSSTPTYDDGVVRQFAIMTVVWGIVGMLVGVVLAAQLAWPQLNFDIPYLSYGPPPPVAHERRDLRVRRLGALRDGLLRRPEDLAHEPLPARPWPPSPSGAGSS